MWLAGSDGEATTAGSSDASADGNTCVARSGSGCTATTDEQQHEAGAGGAKSKYHLSCLTHGQQRVSLDTHYRKNTAVTIIIRMCSTWLLI